VPIIAELHQALRNVGSFSTSAMTLCVNTSGCPWTLDGYSCSFRKALKTLEERELVGEGLTFHGLRHTVATLLAETGVSVEDIAAMLGQQTSQMAVHYSREADRSRRTREAVKKFRPLGEK
jgi:integrase